jgi:hypothetical protein
MNNLPDQCPICGGDITITRIHCDICDSTIESKFAPVGSKFNRLNGEQLDFLEIFVRCEGKLNRMETELGLSYPTIRGRLHEVIRALGYEPGKEETESRRTAPTKPALGEGERKRILDELDKGVINVEQAIKQLSREG